MLHLEVLILLKLPLPGSSLSSGNWKRMNCAKQKFIWWQTDTHKTINKKIKYEHDIISNIVPNSISVAIVLVAPLKEEQQQKQLSKNNKQKQNNTNNKRLKLFCWVHHDSALQIFRILITIVSSALLLSTMWNLTSCK